MCLWSDNWCAVHKPKHLALRVITAPYVGGLARQGWRCSAVGSLPAVRLALAAHRQYVILCDGSQKDLCP